MQKLTDSHSIGTTTDALRFLDVRLRSRPQTEDLAKLTFAERVELGAKYGEYLDARELRVAASAELAYVDGLLDGDVRGLAREALVLTAGKTDDPRYRTLFPITAAQATKPVGGDAQERFVRGVIDVLTNDDTLAPLRPHADRLQARLDALNAALAQREDLYVPEARARTAYHIALEHARRTYNLCHAHLTLLFPDDPALVESFFRPLSGRASRTVQTIIGDTPAAVTNDPSPTTDSPQ